jgi:hypothetical protein
MRAKAERLSTRLVRVAARVLLLSAVMPVAISTAQEPGARGLIVSGDLGTRLEFIGNEHFAESDATRDDDTRVRTRIRLRVGAGAQLTKSVEVGLRLTTGSSSFPTSAWATAGDFRRLPIQIDQAFLAVKPSPHVRVQTGAGPNPLFTPTELVWDSDVQPMGLSTTAMISGWGLTLAAGQYMLTEARSLSPESENGAYLLAHGVTYALPSPSLALTLGASQYRFVNPDVLARSIQLGELDGEFRTNRFDPAGRVAVDPRNPGRTLPVDYLSGYDILNLSVRASLTGRPLHLAADVAFNRAARRDPSLGPAYRDRENLAYGGMIRYGRSRHPGDWTFGAGFFHIESDAVLALVNSDDLQQTNVRTIPLDVQVLLPGNFRLTWDTYLQRKLDPALPSNGGVVHEENALKVRSRLTASVRF